jgi:hypothetical protein
MCIQNAACDKGKLLCSLAIPLTAFLSPAAPLFRFSSKHSHTFSTHAVFTGTRYRRSYAISIFALWAHWCSCTCSRAKTSCGFIPNRGGASPGSPPNSSIGICLYCRKGLSLRPHLAHVKNGWPCNRRDSRKFGTQFFERVYSPSTHGPHCHAYT